MRRRILALIAVLASSAPAAAQHSLAAGGPYDAAVPAPRAVLGYELGDRFTPHHMMMRYIERVAAASRRVDVDTVAYTHEGRELLAVVITSEANQARLRQILTDAQRLADPRGVSQRDLDVVAARLPAIVWLGYTVHGGEASGAEAALGMIYQLAAGQDAATRLILDSTVVIIDPLQNPDGHERHVQDVGRARSVFGAQPSPSALVHRGSWPGPRTNHYYFDMNRDYYIQSQPETRGRVQIFLKWHPHVAVDAHEMGYNSTYFFPPAMDPVNKIIPQNILDWWEIYATAIARDFDQRGWNYFRREGYDEFYPGYGSSWPLYAGAIGMTFEQASSNGGAIRRTDGTVLTLREAAAHHYTSSWATALTTAQRRSERVRDFQAFRAAAVRDALGAPVRGIALQRDRQGRADSLAQRLLDNGIEVLRTTASTNLSGASAFATAGPPQLAAGSYVVDFSQPLGLLARSILEPDAELDSTFIHEEMESRELGRNNRFYDITAWAMPYTFRVKAWTLRGLPGAVERISAVAPTPVPVPGTARVAYAFEPGSEASIRMLAGLLADSVRVHFAQRAFRVAERDFPHGAFIVRVAANGAGLHDVVSKHAAASGAHVSALNSGMVTAGSDLGSNSVVPIRAPRVALVGGQGIAASSFGAAWYVLDQRMHFPVTNIDVSTLGSAALDEFNVLILPSGSLSSSVSERLAAWVKRGNVLITMDGSTVWVAGDKVGIARLRARNDSTRADDQPGAPLPADVPGAIVRVRADTLSMLTAGIDEREFAVLMASDQIFQTPKDFRPGEVVIRFAPVESLRIAGYIWPEVPARLANTPYLWTERVDRGRLIAFAGDPNFRDMWRGLYPLFANAVLLGGSF